MVKLVASNSIHSKQAGSSPLTAQCYRDECEEEPLLLPSQSDSRPGRHFPEADSLSPGVSDPAPSSSLSSCLLPQLSQSHSFRHIPASISSPYPSAHSTLHPFPSDSAPSFTSSLRDANSPPSYHSFRLLHLLFDLPLTLAILIFFSLLSIFGWPSSYSGSDNRFHLTQLGLGSLTWIASEAIRKCLFRILSSAPNHILRSTALLLFVHTLFQECLRLFAIFLTFPRRMEAISSPFGLSVPHATHPSTGFFRAFDLALGFAAAEVLWRTFELLGMLELYKDLLSSTTTRAWLVGEENIISTDMECANGASRDVNTTALQSNDSDVSETDDLYSDTNDPEIKFIPVDKFMAPLRPRQCDDDGQATIRNEDFDLIVRERKRMHFEQNFGCALWEIPVIIVAVWRLDATLLSLTLTLLLSLPFHSDGTETDLLTHRHLTLSVHASLLPTFVVVVLLHWALSLGWTLGIRATRKPLGMPGISYGTLLLVLSCFFASLAVWGALA